MCVPKRWKGGLLLGMALLLTLLSGCAKKAEDDRLHIVRYQSEVLGKEMIAQVYLPADYRADGAYPVLYFLPAGSGSSYMVINQFGIREAYDRLIEAQAIEPMILVALGIDCSFGMNTAEVAGDVDTGTEHVFQAGRYEDYIVTEIIPEIERLYAVSGERSDRAIGGYSMGGLAALHVAMRNPSLFSRAGGHSPTVFIDDETDLSASQAYTALKNTFYQTEALQRARNPLYLAESEDLTGLSFYLDTGLSDGNIRGLTAIADALKANAADVQLHLFPGAHSISYCNTYMETYLKFYAGK